MVELKNVSFCYENSRNVIDDISFQIDECASVAVLGANGCGKSTLLQLIGGCLQPIDGTIIIDGVPVNSENLPLIQKKVYYSKQSVQTSKSSVYDLIHSQAKHKELCEIKSQEIANHSISLMGIENLKSCKFHTLSIGEQKCVQLAGAFASLSSILLFDEPTAFLDSKTRRTVISALQILRHTKLIATNDIGFALEVCSKALLLKDGKLFAYGDMEKVLSNYSLLKQCHLELPMSANKYFEHAYYKI